MEATICFIGAGNMAQSLIGGLISSGYDKNKIIATDPNQEQRDLVTQKFAIQCLADNDQAIGQSSIVVLAVKPQILQQVCAEIENIVNQQNPLLLSVAAGIRSADIARWLGGDKAIVRTMPNTPSLIQSGATGMFANDSVSLEQKSQAEHIMRAAGLTIWVDEEPQLDAVTALSGSGPAYYFLFMEAMEKAGAELGLDAKTAHLLTLQTALGAAKMALESHQDCQTLRRNVTSPNGTTEKAIQSFQSNNLESIVKTAMQAAQSRAKELADELGG
ncbi:pyrroline-5-carboxylate reductase [Thiomicrorhabdus sediminis]|uniref:Pyrroline-5-carboxylate reductase n=1 Tax=Thiomicrorhabdus sediminis TaxID=2580412 RepID=A0A4P9K8V0_9GAMM|nr:pyrroline-5-carboxylate reductase [Thiomicrorhabdus sediminis]QCU90846.1 pyrroline-5-carboxylate reductase [Thiomicrorhabdus sediminis]